MDIPERIRRNIWDRIEIREPDECWPWKLSRGNHGYGQVGWHTDGVRQMMLAHRVVYEVAIGPIPMAPRGRNQMTVDHLCRNKPCCNPAHLRLLPNAVNAADNGFNRKTHCPHGHEYSIENTYYSPKGDRRCRTCIRARN